MWLLKFRVKGQQHCLLNFIKFYQTRISGLFHVHINTGVACLVFELGCLMTQDTMHLNGNTMSRTSEDE